LEDKEYNIFVNKQHINIISSTIEKVFILHSKGSLDLIRSNKINIKNAQRLHGKIKYINLIYFIWYSLNIIVK